MEQLILITNTFTINDGLMVSVGVILFLSLVSIVKQRKQQQQQAVSMHSLQKDLRALANAAVGVGGRVLEIERQQRKQLMPAVKTDKNSHLQEVTNSSPVPVDLYGSSNQPYEQAIRMAQTGASTKDIVNVCGLSQSEADLVSMMHRLDIAT